MTNIALYIHIPFCNSKCDYCDFYSICGDQKAKNQYLVALTNEIEKQSNILSSKKVTSIYIGGGTPSVMPPIFFVSLKNELDKYCIYSDNLEFTVEVNPNSFNEKLAKTLKNIGVNRISIGLQSANDNLLKGVNRLHTFNDFTNCCILTKKYFDNFSVDIMLGLPNQTIKDVRDTLNKVLTFKPKHISCYDLIIEPGTPISQNKQQLSNIPAEKERIKMFNTVLKTLKRRHYQRYEVSNFSLTDKLDIDKYVSKHNKSYWIGDEYLGLGPAAHSFINNIRWENDTNLSEYLKLKYKVSKENITEEMRREEQIMLLLRTKWGVSIDLCNRSHIDLLLKNEYIIIKDNKIFATTRGFEVLNLLIEKLL